jgi:hypothetical protein
MLNGLLDGISDGKDEVRDIACLGESDRATAYSHQCAKLTLITALKAVVTEMPTDINIATLEHVISKVFFTLIKVTSMIILYCAHRISDCTSTRPSAGLGAVANCDRCLHPIQERHPGLGTDSERLDSIPHSDPVRSSIVHPTQVHTRAIRLDLGQPKTIRD